MKKLWTFWEKQFKIALEFYLTPERMPSNQKNQPTVNADETLGKKVTLSIASGIVNCYNHYQICKEVL